MKWTLFVLFMYLFVFMECKEYKIRNTKYGHVEGVLDTLNGIGTVEKYLGIPYARPPIGELRFEDPVDVISWGEQILNATVLPPACVQRFETFGYIQHHYPHYSVHSEDCLYLNIYVPEIKANELIEVLVHIHGGSNGFGMGSMLAGDVLAIKANVILVTFNYRLGVLGFFGTNTHEFPGNYGMKDQVKALEWVQENIHNFGGDKNKVTITGHSAGACDVGLHIISPMSRGLFRAAIMESGSPLAYWCVEHNETFIKEFYTRLANMANCSYDDATQLKNCLKSHDIAVFIHHNPGELTKRYFQFGVTIGGKFLPKDPEKLLKEGNINCNYIMNGLTSFEGLWAVWVDTNVSFNEHITQNLQFVDIPVKYNSNSIKILRKEYGIGVDVENKTHILHSMGQMIGDTVFVVPAVKVAELLAERNIDLYFYSFDYISSHNTETLGVPHGDDLFYLFGSPFTGHPNKNYTDDDKTISAAYIEIYSSFVKNGKPSLLSSSVDVPKYSKNDKVIFHLNSNQAGNAEITLGELDNKRQEQYEFWENCLYYLKLGKNVDCNGTIPLCSNCIVLLVLFLIVLI